MSDELETLEAAAWGSYVDPTEYLRDDPNFGFYSVVNVRSDRADGADYPTFRSETELGMIRAVGRMLVSSSEHATNAVAMFVAFTLGTGFTWKAAAREGVSENSGQAAAIATAIMESVIERCHWTMNRDDEFMRRAIRDGEVFLFLSSCRNKEVAMRFVEPAQVCEPAANIAREIESRLYDGEVGSWSFGIHTKLNDVENVLGYFVQWTDSPADFQYIPASRMVHFKRNVDLNVKRGVSDFYPLQRTLPKTMRLLFNMLTGGANQAAINWILELPESTTKEQASNVHAANSVRSESGPSFAARPVTSYPAGTTITTKAGVQYKPGPMGAERNAGFIEVLQAALRSIGIRWGFPEYLISGDASNANYASTLAASSPFGRVRMQDQTRFGNVWTEMFWKVLAIEYQGSELLQSIASPFGTLRMMIKLVYSAPEVQIQDAMEQIASAQAKRDLGVKTSVLIRELGYDPETESDVSETDSQSPAQPGALGSMSTLQRRRNDKAITEWAEQFGAGTMSEATFRARLSELGFSTATIDAIVTDAADGTLSHIPESPEGSPDNAATSAGRNIHEPSGPTALESAVQIITAVRNGMPVSAGAKLLKRFAGIDGDDADTLLKAAGEDGELLEALQEWSRQL